MKQGMVRILLTSGPTRQYLDPVRYLTNGSSGRMGKALAEAALEAGHEVVIVSGLIAAAAPCDYRPHAVATEKIHKTGGTLDVQFVETPDIVAKLRAIKTTQW